MQKMMCLEERNGVGRWVSLKFYKDIVHGRQAGAVFKACWPNIDQCGCCTTMVVSCPFCLSTPTNSDVHVNMHLSATIGTLPTQSTHSGRMGGTACRSPSCGSLSCWPDGSGGADGRSSACSCPPPRPSRRFESVCSAADFG